MNLRTYLLTAFCLVNSMLVSLDDMPKRVSGFKCGDPGLDSKLEMEKLRYGMLLPDPEISQYTVQEHLKGFCTTQNSNS